MTTTLDLTALKRRQRDVWQTGDYAAVGARISFAAELLCERAALAPASRVLDVATGTGNGVLAAARRACVAVGLDFSPQLLERARRRAEGEGFDIELVEGDAEALPFPDASFDAVVSIFGVMFAPDQERAARELLRVCRPGGTIGLACWTPGGFAGELFVLVARYAPPPPSLPPPVRWGTEAGLRELLPDVRSLEAVERQQVIRHRTPEEFAAFYAKTFGPVRTAAEGLDEAGRVSLLADLADLVRRFRLAGGAAVVPSAYLEAIAVRA